jgi:hypothetical protein
MSNFFLILSFLTLSSSVAIAEDIFRQDCKEVGDYIYDHAGEVYNSLYVLYNGTEEKKAKTFETFFRSKSYVHNRPLGWGITKRAAYYEKNYIDSLNYLSKNSLQEKIFFKERLDQRSFMNFKKEERAFNLFFAGYYCRKLIGKNIRSCRRNLKNLFNLAKIQRLKKGEKGAVTSLSLPGVLEGVLTSSSHLKLSYKAVKALLPGAISKEYKSSSNIFELLTSYSSQLALPQQLRDDLVWDTLGTYSTRGASFEGYKEHLFSSSNTYHFSLMYELFNLIHVYDSKRSPQEGQFSLPQFKRNTCQFGKSYHFWMAAYLSRHLVKKGYSKEEAFQASFAMGVLYDFMGSGAPQRERVRVLNEGMDSIYVKSIFQSILFKSLGALYGADQAAISKLDVNKIYEQMRVAATDYKGKVHMKEIYHMKNLPAFIQKLGIKNLLNNISKNM